MTYGKLVMAASLLMAAGCAGSGGSPGGGAGGAEGGGSPKPFIQIQSAIDDGATNAGQGPFVVTFYGAGRTLDAATLADLASRLDIATWPEGAPVAVITAVDPPKAMTTSSTATAYVSVADVLAGRWYALRFGPPQDGLTTQQTFDSNLWGVRLRPDSRPAARLIEFCTSNATAAGMKFIVTFSEPVTFDSPADTLIVQQNGATVSCRLDGVGAADVHEFCPTLVAAPTTVSLAGGMVRGLNGLPLGAQHWPVDIAHLPLVESACYGYRVSLTE